MVMMENELRDSTMPRARKMKRISVSSKRQISIPKEFHEMLNIGEEVTIELHGDHLVVKPIRENFDDFSERILEDLVAEGYSGEDLLQEFKNRKEQIGNAVNSLISETRAKGKKMTINDLFGEDSEDDEV
jgi:bifunctional DNA-binding transcriptional regulator/antitoxin component of YhaV-PrlF toxin-antitoxin module